MNLGFATLLAVLAATVAECSYILYTEPCSGPPLNSFYSSVCYYNGTLYTGDCKLDYSSELFIFDKNNGTAPTGITFTSFHESPTGWQNMYLFPKKVASPGFTSPHSAFLPPGSDGFNFTVAKDGYLRYKNNNKWYACPGSGSYSRYYEIFYAGGGLNTVKNCTHVSLKAQPYGTCA